MTSNEIRDEAIDESGANNIEASNGSGDGSSEANAVESACLDPSQNVQESSRKEADASVNASSNEAYKPMAIKKKHRRGSRRSRKKYKPYSKLTWEGEESCGGARQPESG